jgi:hypothetical protein
MGEAKRRGTREERVAAATALGVRLADAGAPGTVEIEELDTPEKVTVALDHMFGNAAVLGIPGQLRHGRLPGKAKRVFLAPRGPK